MATVTISPLSEPLRQHATRWPRPRFLPSPPPVFSGGAPTDQDRALALALWRALDPISRRWYVGWDPDTREFAGLPLTADDIASMQEQT